MYNENIYDSLLEQFNRFMRREGKVIHNYWDNTKYKCFFRRNKDTNQTNNNVTIFYPVSEQIKPGMTLKFKNRIFIALNQETVENDVYYRSDLLETNTKIEIYKQGKIIETPAYAYDITSTSPQNAGNQIILVSGEIEIITEHSSASGMIEIDDMFQAMGGTYQVINKYFTDNGIVRFFVKRTANNPNNRYEIAITNTENNYDIGESFKIEVLTQYVTSSERITINNASVSFASNDSDIAQIDNNGNVLCTGSGIAVITATWDERGVSDTLELLVSQEPQVEVPPRMEVTAVDGRNDYVILNADKVFKIQIWDKYGNEQIPPIFDYWDDSFYSPFFKEISRDGNFITLRMSTTTYLNKFMWLEFYSDALKLSVEFNLKVVNSYPA